MPDNQKPIDGGGPAMNVPQPIEALIPVQDLICPFLSGGMVMAMAQARTTVMTPNAPSGIIQQPVRYYMACLKDKCAIWDGENECCGLLTVGEGDREVSEPDE